MKRLLAIALLAVAIYAVVYLVGIVYNFLFALILPIMWVCFWGIGLCLAFIAASIVWRLMK